ncbi:MAG: aminoacetone oxidase family FAD-binding enzyme [Candidatus Magasanikbacteria bacterium CG10_big_fil_rev_8_21_14_0_10_36_32]|uniref:Aminoacetone oxidase family FAD-binding enzyme n=1 Tax=Candidatus Magasanikbacteria bacterium CG10_big_fil_rev_8_21_14_0_10_36_32 TaxID=1974646 RepID=A0A2M6W6V4_9BACT|nr:MAG: aminoacetone oxidase family FAD-binding enzyme [Candidatus Magasanikbacteria bacterium CG10_big_fil_rev_8_21_14_0_10_36_32]
MAEENKFDVAVVGAGPAGIMAAGAAAEFGAKVILIDQNTKPGKKLLLTGNGRCNITNAEFNLRKLVENYGENGKFLFHAFFVFGPKKVINFFNRLGVKTKIENDGRVFPISERSSDVLNALEKYLSKNKVSICLNSRVSRIVFKKNKIEKLVVENKSIIAEKYIFCTGGKSYPMTGSTGDGFKWIRDFGHTVDELLPALVPIKIKEDWVKKLQGLVFKNIKIIVCQNNKRYFKETGDILFTHFGASGPAILNISGRVGGLLKQGAVKLSLDIFPSLNLEFLNKKIQDKINQNPKKSIKSLLSDFVPNRFAVALLENLNLKTDKQIINITKKEINKIAVYLKNIEITVEELCGFDLAMVTKGGVSLKEINNKTMKSKIIDNLFFAGEIISADGRTGGFNLQICWSTGYLAGKNCFF